MDRPTKPINWFAVIGLSLGITVLLVVAGYVMYFGSSSSDSYSSAYDVSMLAYSVLVLVLFICLPILLGSKFGWRTVLTTIVFQSVFLSMVALGVSFASRTTQPEPMPYDGGSIMNGVTDSKVN